jgi:hypothetical protein
MAHTQKRQRGNGEVRYYVRWRFEDQERVRSFRRARDAKTFRRQIEHDDLVGVHVDPARGDIQFGVYAEAWLEARRRNDGRALAPRTRELHRHSARPVRPARPCKAVAQRHPHQKMSASSIPASPTRPARCKPRRPTDSCATCSRTYSASVNLARRSTPLSPHPSAAGLLRLQGEPDLQALLDTVDLSELDAG